MDDTERLVGVWDFGGMPVEIRGEGHSLVVRLPGAPEGFDPSLRPAEEPGTFVIDRGSFAGAVVDGRTDPPSVGPVDLVRVEGDFTDPPGYGLLPPEFSPDDERDRSFAALAGEFGDGSEIEWTAAYSKHEFVQWLTDQDRYVFHGSNKRDIDEFVPVRTSVELYDESGRGNLGAVYGTHYGLWSLFFAVIDRSAAGGSIRNGVTRFESSSGEAVDVYQFSIDRESLPQRPFTTGALYILPRESFRQIPLWPGGPLSNEWASPTKVRPLARLTIEPEDFPFLDRIGGHDDGPLLRMLELTRALFDRATSARSIDDGFAIDLPWSDETVALYDEWHGLFGQMMPGVDVGFSGTGDRREWTLQGPEAFRSTATEWLGDLLSD